MNHDGSTVWEEVLVVKTVELQLDFWDVDAR
jgi:hypothetical protein